MPGNMTSIEILSRLRQLNVGVRLGGDRLFLDAPKGVLTDDLLAAQNPAETDSFVRRDHVVSDLEQASPLTAAIPEPPQADLPFGFLRYAAPGTLPVLAVNPPALAPVENRPPPAA